MAPRSRSSPIASPSAKPACLIAAALALAAAAGAASVPGAFGVLQARSREDVSIGRLWEAAGLAEQAAALSGLPAAERTQALREAARLRLALGEASAARNDLLQAMSLDPRDDRTLLALAEVTRDQPDQALGYAQKASEAAPRGRRRAAAELLEGRIRLDLGDAAGARSVLQKALDDAPGDLDVLGALASAAGSGPAAEAYADQAAAAADGEPAWRRAAADRLSAEIYRQAGDGPKAVAALRRALAVAPDDLDAWEALARLKREQPAAFAGAEAALPPSRGAPQDADPIESLRRRIEADLSSGRREEAFRLTEHLMEEALDAPVWQQPSAYVLAARLWQTLGEAQRACRSVLRLWELDYKSPAGAVLIRDFVATGLIEERSLPDDTSKYHDFLGRGYIDLARARVDAGDGPAAEAALAKAAASPAADDQVGFYRQIALIQSDLGDNAAAAESIARALALAPADEESLKAAARIELAAGRPRQALAAVKPLLARLDQESAGERAEVYRQESQIELALGRSSAALESVALALRADPGDPASLEQAARLYRLQSAAESERSDFDSAQASIDQALAAAPGDAESLQQAIDLSLARGLTRRALSYSDRLLQALKESAPERLAAAYRQNGQLHRGLGELAAAESRLAQAAAAAPEDPATLREKIALALAEGRFREALADAQSLVKQQERRKASAADRAAAYLQRAQIERRLGDPASARASLERALALSPDDPACLREAAALELAAGRPRRALEDSERLLAADAAASPGERSSDDLQRAGIQRELQDLAGAEKTLRRAVSLAPDSYAAIEALAELEIETSRGGEALALLARRPPRLADPLAQWLLLRGAARAQTGDLPGARREFSAAVTASPSAACHDPILTPDRLAPPYFDACIGRFSSDARLYADRGVARYRAGQADGAISDFRRALALNADFPEAALSLASALAARNRGAEAAKVVERALARRPAAKGGKSQVYDELEDLRRSLGKAAR